MGGRALEQPWVQRECVSVVCGGWRVVECGEWRGEWSVKFECEFFFFSFRRDIFFFLFSLNKENDFFSLFYERIFIIIY